MLTISSRNNFSFEAKKMLAAVGKVRASVAALEKEGKPGGPGADCKSPAGKPPYPLLSLEEVGTIGEMGKWQERRRSGGRRLERGFRIDIDVRTMEQEAPEQSKIAARFLWFFAMHTQPGRGNVGLTHCSCFGQSKLWSTTEKLKKALFRKLDRPNPGLAGDLFCDVG